MNLPSNHGRPYTREDVHAMCSLWGQGKTVKHIASKLHRKNSGVLCKLHNCGKLDLHLTHLQERLGCYNWNDIEDDIGEINKDNLNSYNIQSKEGNKTMSNKRKLVEIRVWTDSKLINNSDALVYTISNLIVTDNDRLQDFRDDTLINEGLHLKTVLKKLNTTYGLEEEDCITLSSLRWEMVNI